MKLVYADMHGNLKAMFKEPFNWKLVHVFNSKMELIEIVAKTDHEDPSDMYGYDKSWKNHI